MFVPRSVQTALLALGSGILIGSAPLPEPMPVAGGSELDLGALDALDDELLGEQRGGFVVAGLEVSLGAELRTYLEGDLVMRTTISWQADGLQKDQWVSGVLSPATAEQLQAGVLNTGGITMRVGDQSVYLANQGQTAIIQRTDGGLQNLLINTASNTHLRQEADIAIGLSGYDGFSRDMAIATTTSGLFSAIDQSAIAATPF